MFIEDSLVVTAWDRSPGLCDLLRQGPQGLTKNASRGGQIDGQARLRIKVMLLYYGRSLAMVAP
jgi:hypothetical protein